MFKSPLHENHTVTEPMTDLAMTGVCGLDDILGGGLSRGNVFLLEGSPGTGKTTIATQFLLEGKTRGEACLYVTLSESKKEMLDTARSHGWNIDALTIFELVPSETMLNDHEQSLLYSSDLELGETISGILEAFEQVQPDRVVIDSLSEIRLLAQSSLRYRRQILALKQFFSTKHVTVLMLDDLTADAQDKTVHSVAHGVIRLEELAPNYGAERRRLRVTKYRGMRYRGGYHDFAIDTGGVRAFPRLVSAEHKSQFVQDMVCSGLAPLDALLGGGIERGSSVLVLGPAGTGKSLLTLTFVAAAIARGERAAMFVFDEEIGMLFKRALKLGIDMQAMVDRKSLFIEQVDAAELSPGEFSQRVRTSVENHGVHTIVVDSLNGYQAAMPRKTRWSCICTNCCSI